MLGQSKNPFDLTSYNNRSYRYDLNYFYAHVLIHVELHLGVASVVQNKSLYFWLFEYRYLK